MGATPRLIGASDGRMAARWPHLWGGCLLAALASTVAVAGDGEVYTWRDGSGRVHYGTQPPEGQAAEPVQLNAKPVTVQPTERIYTWTNAEGKTQYGARPPTNSAVRELKEEDTPFSTIRSTQIRTGERQLLLEQQRNAPRRPQP